MTTPICFLIYCSWAFLYHATGVAQAELSAISFLCQCFARGEMYREHIKKDAAAIPNAASPVNKNQQLILVTI